MDGWGTCDRQHLPSVWDRARSFCLLGSAPQKSPLAILLWFGGHQFAFWRLSLSWGCFIEEGFDPRNGGRVECSIFWGNIFFSEVMSAFFSRFWQNKLVTLWEVAQQVGYLVGKWQNKLVTLWESGKESGKTNWLLYGKVANRLVALWENGKTSWLLCGKVAKEVGYFVGDLFAKNLTEYQNMWSDSRKTCEQTSGKVFGKVGLEFSVWGSQGVLNPAKLTYARAILSAKINGMTSVALISNANKRHDQCSIDLPTPCPHPPRIEERSWWSRDWGEHLSRCLFIAAPVVSPLNSSKRECVSGTAEVCLWRLDANHVNLNANWSEDTIRANLPSILGRGCCCHSCPSSILRINVRCVWLQCSSLPCD